MRLFKKALFLVIALTIFLKNNSIVKAYPTPIFDSLTPNLQEIMRLDGEKYLRSQVSSETPEEFAEWELSGENVEIDGNLYKGHGGPMKLTNEDIESLYNLPNVKQLDLKRFDLKDVDINKFLNINKNNTMEFLDLNDCYFGTYDKKKIVARITNKEYTVGIHPCIWIAWPGVNPDDIFYAR